MSGAEGEMAEERQVLAGEYVLGALDAAEMRAVRRRAAADPDLARAIAAWEQRLTPLAALVAPVAPPPALWSRIAEAVAALPDEPVEPIPLHAPTERLVTRPPPRRVWPWQVATAAALALAAGIAAFALVPARVPELRVAALTQAGTTTPGFLAETQPDGGVVLTALAAVPVPAGHDLELWVLPKGATVPKSLGVLPAGGRRLTLPVPPAPGTQLMVSLEPPGGSPTGAPSGPVMYAGSF